ncbi:MAG: radical SAM protein [Oligoflexales bacterium]
MSEIGTENILAFRAPNPPPHHFKKPIPTTTPEVTDGGISEPKTPIYDKIIQEHEKLSKLSKYKCDFDFTIYENLEKRFAKKPPRGGILYNSQFKLINHHSSCQECLYAFMIDTYGRGCVHNCGYCYARSELVVHGYWNNPIPMPININDVRKIFYTVFETEKRSKWRQIIEKRIPLRIGHASDSFMWADQKYKVGLELLKILKYYKYPYVIATRSDLISHDDYIDALDPNLAAVQMSLASTNEEMNKLIEPGAPSAKRRLSSLQKLVKHGFWTTVRLNPLFPIYPDHYFTDPGSMSMDKKDLKLDIFNWNMIAEIASYDIPSLLAGFGRFSPYAMNVMSKSLDVDLRNFFDGKKFQVSRDYHFSDEEIRYYYTKIRDLCRQNGIEFTTCYIGNGESHFWKDQDLWDNKKDCCNAKNRIKGFVTDSQEVPFSVRQKFNTKGKGKGKGNKSMPERDKINISKLIPDTIDTNPFLQS